MPKELTYSDENIFYRDKDGNELEAENAKPGEGATMLRRGVHIGWASNKYVEIGVAEFEISTEHGEQGYYTTLDRDGINRVIKSLKKARDKAYGKDE